MNGPALNTDRELYREDTGDPAGSYYENSVHVTATGGIGMNVGGRVIVQPIAAWHALAVATPVRPARPIRRLLARLTPHWAERSYADGACKKAGRP